jgi:anthranilate synthase/indole-3-glycerol phosphate synthase/phosphoribosylanthranilate isomerase
VVAELTILDTIVAQRRLDIADARALWPAGLLRAALAEAPAPLDFAARLRKDSPMAVIAEVKRASPSKGDIAPGLDAVEQAMKYANGGAAGISVLTEPRWFKGSLDDLAGVRAAVEGLGAGRPALLRKDFIVDEYQVLEARVAGADSVLLIVASLDDAKLTELMALSRELGMEPLVEVNNAAEMERALASGATVIGINNRDLRSFEVDLGTTDRLAGMVSGGVLLCALSGISTREDVERFQAAGAGAVLVGESLMVAADPGAKIAELRGGIHDSRFTIHHSAGALGGETAPQRAAATGGVEEVVPR